MIHTLMYLFQLVLVKSRERGKKKSKEKIPKCAKKGVQIMLLHGLGLHYSSCVLHMSERRRRWGK